MTACCLGISVLSVCLPDPCPGSHAGTSSESRPDVLGSPALGGGPGPPRSSVLSAGQALDLPCLPPGGV